MELETDLCDIQTRITLELKSKLQSTNYTSKNKNGLKLKFRKEVGK